MRTRPDRDLPARQGSAEPSAQELLRYLETLQAHIQADINSLPNRRVPTSETLANACYVDFLHRQRANNGAAEAPLLTPDPRLGLPSHRPMREGLGGTSGAQNSSFLDRVLTLSLERDNMLTGADEEECSDQAEASSQFGTDDDSRMDEQIISQSQQQD
jgi:hypothetical protein